MKERLLHLLLEEKQMHLKGGLYHKTQVNLAYNSNRIEGSRLSEEQTRYIYETNTILSEGEEPLKVDDILETINHFQCFDYMIDIHSIVNLSGTKIPKDVKIKHLLTHTSGIADDTEEEKGESYADLFKNYPNYSIRENKDFIKNFTYKEPNFKPGKKIYYNNCAFILLGLAIEKITERGYREFITEEIFKPFHMNNTFFSSKEDNDRTFAEGYFYDVNGDLKKNIYSFPPIGTADSGAYTTVEDLDIFIRKINISDVYKKMLLPQTDIKIPKEDYLYTMGFAFELREKGEEIIRVHKDGCNVGICNITVFYPKEDITFSILGNVECNIWELQNKAEKILFA